MTPALWKELMGAANRVLYGTAKWKGKMRARALSTCYIVPCHVLHLVPWASPRQVSSWPLTRWDSHVFAWRLQTPPYCLLVWVLLKSCWYLGERLAHRLLGFPPGCQSLWLVPCNYKTSFCKYSPWSSGALLSRRGVTGALICPQQLQSALSDMIVRGFCMYAPEEED